MSVCGLPLYAGVFGSFFDVAEFGVGSEKRLFPNRNVAIVLVFGCLVHAPDYTTHDQEILLTLSLLNGKEVSSTHTASHFHTCGSLRE
jgi:hypothetical protein